MSTETAVATNTGSNWRPADRMGRLIAPWLERSDTDPSVLDQLFLWLQGSGLPPFGNDEEPYESVLAGLEFAHGQGGEDGRICRRVAHLLDERQPDVHRPGLRPDEGLYNLFQLCARLKCPGTLCEPLWRLYQRGKIRGSYRGLDLRGALAIALTFNQVDDRLREDWRGMFEPTPQRRSRTLRWIAGGASGSTSGLIGGPHTGFSGLLRMPPAAGRLGRPSKEDIRFGLHGMSAYLEAEPDVIVRRTVFHDLLATVQQAHERPYWNERFYQWADSDRWSEWAVFCIRSFVPKVAAAPEQASSAFAWDGLAHCVFDEATLRNTTIKKLCRDRVYEIRIGDWRDLSPDLSAVADWIEDFFSKLPQSIDPKSILGICEHAIRTLDPQAQRSAGRASGSASNSLVARCKDVLAQSHHIPSPVTSGN